MASPPTPPDDPFPEQGDYKARQDWFERRLEKRSREDCILIAARAALRVLPNITFMLPKDIYGKKAQENLKNIVLYLMRKYTIPTVASLASAVNLDNFIAATSTAYGSIYAENGGAASAANFAADAVTDASYPGRQISAAGTAVYIAYSAYPVYSATAFKADLAWLDGSHVARERLAASPLWLSRSGKPQEILDNWNTFSAQLRALGNDWDVWAEWYGGGVHEGKRFPGVLQGAQNGRYLFGLSTARALQLWHDVALLPNELWEGEPAALNAEFKRLVEEARVEVAEKSSENSDPPTIPTPKPSAIEPIWEDGRLILPAISTPSDGSGENVLAALQALKEEFAELVEDAAGEANIDSRAITYLSRLAERIPNQAPTNLELHRIAQNESALQAYGKTVTDEWPGFLAVRYHALALQFTRAMAQFPNWREFKRIAAQSDLTKEQVEQAPETANEFAEELKDETFEEFVDPEISEKLKAFSDLAESGEGEAIILGKDMLAVDLLNSVETILIRLAEAALASAKGTGKLAGKTWNEFAKRAQKSVVEQAGKAGDAVGPAIAKWLKRGLYGGAAYLAGPPALAKAAPFITKFIETYPTWFGWLEQIIKLLG